jgi:hypothetical protein
MPEVSLRKPSAYMVPAVRPLLGRHPAPLPGPNRLLSERLLLGPAIECGNVRFWVESGPASWTFLTCQRVG